MARVIVLAVLALLGFAANSVLARLALGGGSIEPLAYTGIRLLSGALALAVLIWSRERSGLVDMVRAGSWPGAAALAAYAIAFSLAYVLLGAGTGALILFASVQFGILGRAIALGDRPGALEWLGLAIAMGALVYLLSPGLAAPHPLGAVLMVVAGLSWAAYTLIGRGSTRPLANTGGNFMRTVPIAAIMAVAGVLIQQPGSAGLAYAVASGALASGLGYAVWYAVLPQLSRTSAAVVQLIVPSLAALGGVLLIGEELTARLVIASVAVLGGVGIAIVAGERRRRLDARGG